MKVEAIKISFLTYLRHLGTYDYLALGWFIVTFLILIVLATIVAKRASTFSLLLIISALLFFIIAPFLLKFKLNTLLRPTSVEIHMVKKLTFSDSVIVEASIHNVSEKDFKLCFVQTTIIKQNATEGIRSYLNLLKPIANQSILVQQSLPKGEILEHKAVFDDFTYKGEIVAHIKTECY